MARRRQQPLAAVLLAGAVAGVGAAPFAPPLVVPVGRGESAVIALNGWDASGRPLAPSIVRLPGQGTLYQLSQVFSDYGYEPALGKPLTASSVLPVAVTGSANRVIFVAPEAASTPMGAWGTFEYTVTDGFGVSSPGTVWLVPRHGRVAFSDFTLDGDGWAIASNGAKAAALVAGGLVFEAFSRGALNHYVLGGDAEIASPSPGAQDVSLWRFVAPPKFAGNQVAAYGGVFTFVIGTFAGDFSADQLIAGAPLVTLECDTCANGAGVRLGHFVGDGAALGGSSSLEAATRTTRVPLLPGAWREDPKNSLTAWTPVSDCRLVAVLTALSRVTILGDQTLWFETVAVDDVGFLHVADPRAAFRIPRACLT